jgi:hypothetical protein
LTLAPKNFKRDRFALELYAGKPVVEAHEIAGFKPGKGGANARKLANSADIRRRIGQMFAEERGYAEIEAMRARRERHILAYSDITNYFEHVIDVDGKPTGRVKIKDFTKLPRELTAAIRTIKPTKFGWELGLHDKDSSLRSIEDRVDPKPEQSSGVLVNVNQTMAMGPDLSSLSDDELASLERLMAKATDAGNGACGARVRIAGQLEKIARNSVDDDAVQTDDDRCEK